ncbi:hypothetical protein CYLTODRAFT_364445 [Cylindrobasidium torrendii FP15055 ss-10]|uniref:DUF676 domain-containing protein n=1 Tax=Cylindrobasidium torrendii FP15055 ss-10 TaxID=1314674 RepID=A0A0D7BUK1_9AGAR|nr:hypothetical protein CYLTODRAFT_364445 [Cylindrobasidium torrendii FP15055 ss-10]
MDSDSKALSKKPSDHLVIVFIHGFKGDDKTFLEFPQRLQHILEHTIPDTKVESIVFPVYETKGDLNEAVVRFADWLTTLTVEREVASGGGAGTVKVVLCGHSMGGLLAADTLREFVKNKPDGTAPLWPKIIACLAFDTPYLGLHPHVFKNAATKAGQYANAARMVGSTIMGSFAGFGAKTAGTSTPPPAPTSPKTGWSKWAPAAYAMGGAVFAGAAAGAAYYKRDDLGIGYTWATDHMRYVGTLWDEANLIKRVDDLLDIEDQEGVAFKVFYTYLPDIPMLYDQPRTFVILPKKSARSFPSFKPARNTIAPDELQAHTGMFSGKTNDGYYELGLETARLIREAIMLGRGIFEDPVTVQDELKEELTEDMAQRPEKTPEPPEALATDTAGPGTEKVREATTEQDTEIAGKA